MIDIDKKQLSSKIEQNKPISLTFQYIDEEILILLNSIILKYLSKMDFVFLLNTLITILREIVVNALKANAKRVFFEKNGFNIHDKNNYILGMKKFKAKVIGVFDIIKRDLYGSAYYINMSFEKKNDGLYIKVINNTPILQEELQRINYRIEKALKYNDFSEVYEDIEDNSEGAGLGIVLTILFLKNMGINPRRFSIKSNSSITKTTLIIPNELRSVEITTAVKKHILNEIEGLPTFPENIIQLQRLCRDPESSINEISKKIMLDPALTTDVIKLSNSAGFVPGKRIESVNEAVMTIGLKNLNAILTASNARRILDKRYTKYEKIWEHCNKTAYYARNIALIYRMNNIVENAYMAGLLHDLGKILLLSTDMSLVQRIGEIVKNRKIITSTIMEEISVGISHSTIGSIVATKWNFPDYLIETIRLHHSPHAANKKYKDLIDTVYLANMFCGIEQRKYSYPYIEESILKKYNLSTEENINNLHKKLKTTYESIRY